MVIAWCRDGVSSPPGGEVRGWPCAPSPEGEIMLSAANDALWRFAVDAC